MSWTDSYIGKPWAARPEPPKSYTCGELCRQVLLERCGLEVPEIVVNAARLRDCLSGLEDPGYYGLLPLEGRQQAQDYDIVYMSRLVRPHHVGLAVKSSDGLMILHCQEYLGVTLDSLSALQGMQQFRSLYWYRHKALCQGQALGGLCR